MRQVKWLVLCVLLAVAAVSCETWKDIGTFNTHRDSIKTVALLPLYIDPNVGNISLGNPEVKGFQDAWKLSFNAQFKKRITFVNNVKILYAGEDFDITPDMLIQPDYAKIAGNLKVDMVMGFTLVTYNEVSQGEAIGWACISALVGTHENMVATYDYHNVYLNQYDLTARLSFSPGGILPTNEAQREAFMTRLIDWIDVNHPLSVNFKK
jgi:hypothetical protein